MEVRNKGMTNGMKGRKGRDEKNGRKGSNYLFIIDEHLERNQVIVCRYFDDFESTSCVN